MQAYIQTVIGIRTKDLEVEEFENIKFTMDIEYCGEGYVGDKNGGIIVLEDKSSETGNEDHFISINEMNNMKFNKDNYDEILSKNNLTQYKDKINLYTFCVEI